MADLSKHGAEELRGALDPDSLEAVADALTEKRHVDRARMLREIARRQRAALSKASGGDDHGE